MNYPYHLGCHLKTGRLCRIPHPDLGFGIPQGFTRIIWYKQSMLLRNGRLMIFNYKEKPYDKNNQLELKYYSIVRWTDIQRELGEKVTGPNMTMVMMWSPK